MTTSKAKWTLPDDAPHRPIDLAIKKVKEELGAKAKLAIMIPPLIYGYNPNRKRLTNQIPTMTRFALKHGFAPKHGSAHHVGQGKSVESNIHVVELARAYVVLLHHMEKESPDNQSLKNPYWLSETTGDKEPSWREVAAAISEGLQKAGKSEDPAPRELPEDRCDDLFGLYTGAVIGLNSRSPANRLRGLVWRPTEKDWKQSYFDDELPQILKEETGNFARYRDRVDFKLENA